MKQMPWEIVRSCTYDYDGVGGRNSNVSKMDREKSMRGEKQRN